MTCFNRSPEGSGNADNKARPEQVAPATGPSVQSLIQARVAAESGERMGLSLEFYAGDADAIGADFTAIEFDGLRDGTRARAYADFSLHLSPTDLDILSSVIAEHVGVAPLSLNDSLVRTVGGFEGEGIAEVVDRAWVRMVAAADEAAAPELTAAWIERVGVECDQQLTVTPEAVRAVRELIHLCRVAVREGVQVVHTCYL